jgi:hypothetical protein
MTQNFCLKLKLIKFRTNLVRRIKTSGNHKMLINTMAMSIILILANMLQYSMSNYTIHIFNLIFIVYLLSNYKRGNNKENIYLSLFYFNLFSLYPRVLYDSTFHFNHFYGGYYKLVVIAIFIFSIGKIKFNKISPLVLLLILQIFAVIVGLTVDMNSIYLLKDIMYIIIIYSPFLLLLQPKRMVNEKEFLIFKNYLNAYAISFIVLNLFILATNNLSINKTGVLIITFGPTNILILALLIYFIRETQGLIRLVNLFAFIIYLPIKLFSINSQEIIIILLALFIYIYFNKKLLIKIAAIIMVFFVVFIFKDAQLQTNNQWINSKVNQVFSLIQPKGLYQASSSFLIRMIEFSLIKEQIILSPYILVGKGHGATVNNTNNALFAATLDESSFPSVEINTGKIHELHESIYNYLKNYGIAGVIIIIIFYKNIINNAQSKYSPNRNLLLAFLAAISLYYFGWSYKVLFTTNFILSIIILNERNNRMGTCNENIYY